MKITTINIDKTGDIVIEEISIPLSYKSYYAMHNKRFAATPLPDCPTREQLLIAIERCERCGENLLARALREAAEIPQLRRDKC